MKNIIFGSLFLLMTACSGSMQQHDIETLRAEVATLKTELNSAVKNAEGQIIHAVYFSLKDDINAEQKAKFIEELNRLGSIEGVRDFQAGSFKDLGDARALSQYNAAILMEFDTEVEYKTYQNHPTHLDVKKGLGAYLAAPPASYDFRKE